MRELFKVAPPTEISREMYVKTRREVEEVVVGDE